MNDREKDGTGRTDIDTDAPEPTQDILDIAKAIQQQMPSRFEQVFPAAIQAYITLRTHRANCA